jgi:ketosteroid isomerase-like protein
MLGSTPVRVAIAAVALVGLVVGYQWWNSPERQIHRMLSEVASALSHDGVETDLRALAAVAGLQTHLLPDVSIDLGRGSPLQGRQDVMAMAARIRATSPMMRVQFFDPEISISGESSGTTRVTVQVTTRDDGGDEVAAAHVVTIVLVKEEGRWQVTSARVLPEDTPL